MNGKKVFSRKKLIKNVFVIHFSFTILNYISHTLATHAVTAIPIFCFIQLAELTELN